ncbi:MAG: HNH endonuclease [Planctomycetota bacterium]
MRACTLDVPVLLLNRSYAALRVISARRAFTLLCKELAEVVHVEGAGFSSHDFASWVELSELQRQIEPEAHDWVRTVRLSIAVPRVIRLLEYDRLPRMEVRLSRRTVFERDNHQCQYCSRYFRTSDLSVDHVLPRARGGGDSWENLVTACIRCNAAKGDRTPSEAGMPLIKKPRRPAPGGVLAGRRGAPRYSAWAAFLPQVR